MKWFRLYTDIIDDPKLSQLSDAEHRRFIHCLAIAAEQEKDGKLIGTINEIAWRIRTKPEAIKNTIQKLISLNILKQNGNGYEFINWKKRQFKTDNPTDRWRKWKSNVGSNVGQTLAPTATETETYTEHIHTTLTPTPSPSQKSVLMYRFDRFWSVYPKKKSKGEAEKAWKSIKPDEQLLATMIATIGRAKKSWEWLREGGQYIPHPATWLRAKGWEDDIDVQDNSKNPQGMCEVCGLRKAGKYRVCEECEKKRSQCE